MTKKVIALVLLLLTISGCAANRDDQTQGSAAPTVQTAPMGKYDADNRVEAETKGAVKVFALEQKEFLRMEAQGKQLLVFAKEEEGIKVMLLAGDTLLPVANALISVAYENVNDIAVLPAGIAFYDNGTNSIVYLDTHLQENNRTKLPEDISGKPYVAPTGEIYYARANEVRQLDPNTNIPRLVRQIVAKTIELKGCYFDGTVLFCEYKDTKDTLRWCYISSQTGMTLSEYDNLHTLTTAGENYFAAMDDGLVHQLIVGTRKEGPKSLNISREKFLGAVPAFNGGVICGASDDELSLSFCDFASGKCAYGVSLKDIEKPTLFCGSGDKGSLWFWAKDLQANTFYLYCWTLSETPIEDANVYTGTLYTAQSPDENGLAECQKQVDKLNSDYGITIRIWENAVRVQGDHTLTPEYQVSSIRETVSQLEEVIKSLPAGFLRKTGRCTDSGAVRICIVRAVDGEQKGTHYWDKDGDYFIVLTPQCDIRDVFLEHLGYVVLTHVMGNSVEMDYWTDYNPEGFTYGEHNVEKKYLAGSTKAFIDEQSMLSVTEDRSRMFLYAMTDLGNGYFETDAMQGKLSLLSLAIRDTYRMRSVKDVLPWEQYLKPQEGEPKT